MAKKQPDQPKKREKPLTLYPLTMDEALKEVLQVKPPPKDKQKQSSK